MDFGLSHAEDRRYPTINADLIIQNCLMLRPDFSISPKVNIGIKNGKIAGIWANIPREKIDKDCQLLDGAGKLALPGLVDAHTHSCQQLLRGGVIDEMPMIWTRILVPFESSLSVQDVYKGARLFCVECLKAGITTIGEAGGRFMEQVAQAILESGLRGCLARSTMDQGDTIPAEMKESSADAIAHTEELYRAFHGKGSDRIRIWFAIRQVMTASPHLVQLTAGHAQSLNTGVHIHLAEHLDEVAFCLQNYHKRPAEWLEAMGLLAPNLLATHCVRLAEREIKLMSEHNVNVVLCPRANISHHGFPKVPVFMALGMNIGLGSDGASGWRLDLFDQMRLLKATTQGRYGLEINDPTILPAFEVLKMATLGGAKALMLDEDIGTLEVGKKADIVLMDINNSHLMPTLNLVNTVVMAAGPEDIQDVIIDGKIIMKDRQLLYLDEEKIRNEASEALIQIAKRASLNFSKSYIG
jgi:5-methylthioadenosine/S-adenosylhomocysteine deaminase